jgi:hypothetical protein
MHRLPTAFAVGCVGLGIALGAPSTQTALAQGRSPIVLNFDGSGTTIVKPVSEGSYFQVQQLWSNNTVNGLQSFADGSYAFLNCLPDRRTNDDVTLNCRIYDQAANVWQEPPIVTTVTRDFLDGPFSNSYNSLFEWTGEYLTAFDIEDQSFSFRVRFLDAISTPTISPVLLGQTTPATDQAFMLRNTDSPDGTTEATNATIGMQFSSFCVDFDLQPSAPGGTLAGTMGARRRNGDGSCGETIVENRSAAFVPTGGAGVAGTYCSYRVVEIGRCSTGGALNVGDRVCLPCSGACRQFTQDIDVTFAGAPGTVCQDIVVEVDEDQEPGGVCSRDCSGKTSVSVVGG